MTQTSCDETVKGLSGAAASVTPISYTPTAAAVVTGRSRSRIFKALKDRELTARKDGRATLIERDELVRWLRTLPTIGRDPRSGSVAA